MNRTQPSCYSRIWPHLPAAVIGAYFISLQSIKTINFSFLILIVGLWLLFITQPKFSFRSVITGAIAIAMVLLISTMASAVAAPHTFIVAAMPVSQIPGLIIVAIFALFVREKLQLSAIVWSWFIGLIICTLQFFSASYEAGYARGRALISLALHPLFLAPNDMLMFVIFLPVVIWYGLSKKNILGWLVVAGYSLLLIALAQFLLSRVALLSITLAFFLPAFFKKRWRILFGFLSAAAIMIAMLAAVDSGLLDKLGAHQFDRIKLWIAAWHMFGDAPLLGHGPGSFTTLYGSYIDRLNLRMSYGHDVRNMGWAHSLFFEAIAEKGLVGLIAIVIYFVYLFSMALKKFKNDRFFQALIISVILLLLAAMVELSLLRVWGIYVVFLMLGLSNLDGETQSGANN